MLLELKNDKTKKIVSLLNPVSDEYQDHIAEVLMKDILSGMGASNTGEFTVRLVRTTPIEAFS